MRVFAGCCLAVVALSCTPVDSGEPAVNRSAITNGSPSTSDPAVVAILDADGELRCTGTLIDPHTVLTAAHCAGSAKDLLAYTVVFGASTSTPDQTARIMRAAVHPSYDSDTRDNDLALVSFGDSVTTKSLAPGQLSTADVGQSARVVGFGITGSGLQDEGTKRQGTASITTVEAQTFRLAPNPSQPCSLDSGGPVLITSGGSEVLAGVVSGGDSQCTSYATAMRVDAYAKELIDPYLAQTKPGAAKPGEPCLYPEHCASGLCVAALDDPRLQHCSQSCDSDDDCLDDQTCSERKGEKLCTYRVPSPGAIGHPCSSDDDCLDSCEHPEGGGASFCSKRCVPGVMPCPDGYECRSFGDITFLCTLPYLEGGCSLTPSPDRGPDAWPAVGLLLGLFVVVWRRRRRR